MNNPTLQDINDELLERVNRVTHSGWRHGVEHEDVYKRKEDDTYWYVSFRVSTDGETHELRDEECDQPIQVWPVSKTVIDYVPTKPV